MDARLVDQMPDIAQGFAGIAHSAGQGFGSALVARHPVGKPHRVSGGAMRYDIGQCSAMICDLAATFLSPQEQRAAIHGVGWKQ